MKADKNNNNNGMKSLGVNIESEQHQQQRETNRTKKQIIDKKMGKKCHKNRKEFNVIYNTYIAFI